MTLATGAEALFTSPLQPSEQPSAVEVRAAIRVSLRRHHGARGCAAAVAVEFGEHPEAAVARMRWALAQVGAIQPAYAAA